MTKVENSTLPQGEDGANNAQPKFEIIPDKVAHRVQEPPAEPQNIGLLGRRFTPEQMRQPLSDEERTTPLCGDLIHSDEWVIISGQPGTGKTVFGIELAGHMARPGGLFMGHPQLKNHSTKRLRVAYLDLELLYVLQRQRSSSYWGDVEYIDLGQTITEEKLKDITDGKISIFDVAQQLLWDTIRECEFDVIVVDSMQRLIQAMERRFVGIFVNKLSASMRFFRGKTGRHINVIIVSHPRKGTSGNAATMEDNSGDAMLTDQCDVALVVKHGRDIRQAYVVQVKEGRGHGGVFTGSRLGGDGECLVYHRYKIDDPVHKDNFGIKLSHERHLERDVMHQPGTGASEEGRKNEAEEVARFMNSYVSRMKAESITPAAISKAIERASARGEIELPGKGTISTKALERLGPLIRTHLHLDVLKRLSNDWG